MSAHGLLCVLAAVLLSGCIDYEELTHPGQRPPNAFIHLNIFLNEESNPPSGPDTMLAVAVHAVVFPGMEAQRPRVLSADTLWAGDVALVPHHQEREGAYFYNGRVEVAPFDTLVFRLPRVRDVSGDLASFAWHPWWRVGSDTLTLRHGDDLVLENRSAFRSAGADAEPNRLHWSLSVWGRNGDVRMGGVGAPPSTFRIPFSLLPAAQEHPIAATLHVNQQIGYSSPGGDYELTADLNSKVSWTVQVMEPID